MVGVALGCCPGSPFSGFLGVSSYPECDELSPPNLEPHRERVPRPLLDGPMRPAGVHNARMSPPLPNAPGTREKTTREDRCQCIGFLCTNHWLKPLMEADESIEELL